MLELQQRWESAAADCMELLQTNGTLIETRVALCRRRAALMDEFVTIARGVVDVSCQLDDRGPGRGGR